MDRATAAWVKKAEADHTSAITLIEANVGLHDAVCFHCQQLAEKYMKALLCVRQMRIPRIHNLVALHTLLAPHYPSLNSHRRGFHILTRFAVETRYPGESATKRHATAALRWAGKVRTACRRELGIRDKPKR